MCAYDPFCGIPADKKHFLVGGECLLWGELTDSVILNGMLWPRACAAAEVLRRGPGRVSEDVTGGDEGEAGGEGFRSWGCADGVVFE